MKKTNRIKDNKDFSKVIKQGHYSKSVGYRVYWLENTLGYARIGISASTKLGNAVVRSTVRRKIRAICDLIIDYQSCSLDIVIIAKKEFIDRDHITNKSEFEDIFIKFLGTKE